MGKNKYSNYTKTISILIDNIDQEMKNIVGGIYCPQYCWLLGRQPDANIVNAALAASYENGCAAYCGITTLTSGYKETPMHKYIAAVYSFRRSRRWNLNSITYAIKMHWIGENFFAYHAIQLYKLFGNHNKYRSAMQTISQRCDIKFNVLYRPDIVREYYNPSDGTWEYYRDLICGYAD